jgi:hypothetical protein
MRPVGPSAHRPHSCTNENLTWTRRFPIFLPTTLQRLAKLVKEQGTLVNIIQIVAVVMSKMNECDFQIIQPGFYTHETAPNRGYAAVTAEIW